MTERDALKTQFDALHATIQNHVKTGTPLARPRKMRKQLLALHDPAWDRDWQKAQILLNCHGRMQPARTHGRLMRLRGAMQADGEQAQFAAFMQVLRDTLHPEFITSHGYVTTFSQMDAERIFNSMGAALSPLSGLHMPFFLFAGALLGHIRDGRLIGHDDDIDVAVMLGECPQDEVAPRWLEVKQQLDARGLIAEADRANDRPVFKFHSDLGSDIDLFPAWSDAGKFSVYPYSLNEISSDVIFPLASFGQDPLKLPAAPEALLVQSYGAEWRIPDPLFHIDWKRKKKQFHMLFDVNYALS